MIEKEKKKIKISANAIKAMGERIVANELTYRGWLTINTNSGEENAPNIDIIALQEDRRITIQVKSTMADSHKDHYFLGQYKPNGEHFNTKDGPKADYIVSVYIHNPAEFSCLVVPVQIAEVMCKKLGQYWMRKPKKNGQVRSENFGVYLGPKREDDYGLSVKEYINAWDVLDK